MYLFVFLVCFCWLVYDYIVIKPRLLSRNNISHNISKNGRMTKKVVAQSVLLIGTDSMLSSRYENTYVRNTTFGTVDICLFGTCTYSRYKGRHT